MKRIATRSLIALSVSSFVAAPCLSTVMANEPTTQKEATSSKVVEKELSAIKPDLAKVGWGTYKENTSVVGDVIKLKVDGKVKEFSSGVAAHAPATLIYNIDGNYDVFEAMLGVDASREQYGIGTVKYTILTSDNNKDWTSKKVVSKKGNEDATSVNVEVTGAKYLKIEIDKVDNMNYDHSVLAAAKLYKKADPVPEALTEAKKEFKALTQAEYDAQIKDLNVKRTGTVEEFAEANRKLIYQRELVSRVPTGVLNNSKEAAEALMENMAALSYFVEVGEADAGASNTKAFENWCKIYNAHKADLTNDFNLKLAVAVSHSHAKNVGFWIGPTYPQWNSAVERYESYKYIVEHGIMDSLGSGPSTKHFKELPVAMMKYAVNARISEDEVVWLARFIEAKKSMDPYKFMKYGKSNPGWNNGYTATFLYDGSKRAEYTKKYLLDAPGSTFKHGLKSGGEYVRRQFAVLEQGGICGAFGYAYAGMYNVMGLPGEGMIQPMHNGALVENGSGIWELKNNLHGWDKTAVRQDIVHLGGNRIMPLTWGAQTWQSIDSASYVILTQAALDDYENYKKATTLMFLGDIYGKQSKEAKEAFKAALNAQPKNPDAACKVAYSSTTAAERKALVDRVTQADALLYYPLPLKDVINFVNRTSSQTEQVSYKTALNNALNKAANATDKNVRQADVCRHMASSILGTVKTEPLASLGTDNEGNPKIVISDTYSKVPGLAWEYSIAGNAWVTGDPAKKETVLNKDTVTGDIRIRIVGSGDSSILTLKYTPINLKRVLIPLNKVSVHAASTTERNYSAASALDGNINTSWMSYSNLRDKNRQNFIVVKFDTVRNLTAVEYASNIKGSDYGRLKVANISVSTDGKTWVNAGNSGNLPNNANISNIPLRQVHKAKYVKIQGVEAHTFWGGMHASILKFYEDRTV